MAKYLKPQTPLQHYSGDYFYPLTTADQVIMDGGYRLNDIVGKVKKSTITLYANGWSVEVPHCYSVIVDGLSNNTNMKILPRFPEDFESKQIMREETAKISFASRNNNILTFECWDEIPTIDIPIDIEINILYPNVPDINLNYSIIGGTTEPENPSENMIWINTENEITSHKLSKYEPNNPVEGMVWIYLGDASNVHFHTLSMNERELDEVYPLSAKQYVSGAWVDVTAKSYQGGEWVDWAKYYIQNGKLVETLSGVLRTGQTVSMSQKDDYVEIKATGQSSGGYAYDSPINVTDYSKLVLHVDILSGVYDQYAVGPVLLTALNASSVTDLNSNIIASTMANAVGTHILECDISKYSGNYYIGINVNCGDNSSKRPSAKIYDFYLVQG